MTPSRGPLAPSGAAPTAPPARRWLVLVLFSFAVGATRGFFYAPGAGVGVKRAARERGYYSSSRPRRSSATSAFLQPFALREPTARGGQCRMAAAAEDGTGAAAAEPEGVVPPKEEGEGGDVKPAKEEEKPVEVEEEKPVVPEEAPLAEESEAVEVEEEKAVVAEVEETAVEEEKTVEVEEEKTVEAVVEEKAVEVEEEKPVVPEVEETAAEEKTAEVAKETPVEVEAEEKTAETEKEAPVEVEATEKAVEVEKETPAVPEAEETVAEEKEAAVADVEEEAPAAEEETPAAEEQEPVVSETKEETPAVEEDKPEAPKVAEEKTAVAEEEQSEAEEEKPVAEEEEEEEAVEAEEVQPVVAEVEEALEAGEENAVEPEEKTVPEPEAAAVPEDEEKEGEEKEESQAESKPEMPELLNPTREELESAFPNPPRAPYPTLPDPRRMTAKQLEAAASQDVSYGGQPAARRANIDFERSERERIHFETATRVMNYEIQAQRSEAAAAAEVDEELSPEEARKLRRAALRDDFYGLIEVTDEDEGIRADYKWDQKPELITFSAFGVLFNWSLPVGLIMREALGRAHHYVHRMPPPGAFEKHFRNSHEEASFHIPCYGAQENISTWEWWFHVFADAYLKTINEFYMDEDIVLTKIDDIVDELYYEIMVGPEAFEVMPLVKVVLDRLAAWRDNNGGPKLAVVADDDDRLHVVLENLGLLPYFDFVLTSRETGCELKETKMYEMAMETAGIKQPQKALHVGAKYDTDITGSCEAGMEAVCVKRMQSLYERPNEPYEFHRVYEIGELLNRLGLPEAEEEYMGRRRGNYWEEMEDEDDEEFLDEFYSAEDDAGMALFEGGQ